LPSALRVFFGSRDIVRFRLATPAAFLMFRRAAAFCFALGMCRIRYATLAREAIVGTRNGRPGGRYFAGWRTEVGRKSWVS
jgi:hypothetical protein